MSTFDDDWPDLLPVGAGFTPDTPRLRAWVDASPRRALGPERLVVARRRRLPGKWVVNSPPTDPADALWSLDEYRAGSWGRRVLPPGVAVDAVRLGEGRDVWLRLSFAPAAADALGIEAGAPVEVTLSFSALGRLPDPPLDAGPALDALCALLAEAGVRLGGVDTRATAHAEAERRADVARRAAEAARDARVWAACAHRTPADLGPHWPVLRSALARASFDDEDLVGDLVRLARVCTALVEAPGAPVRVGGSRLGGCPDLPPGVPWPEIDGERLSFVLQVDLAEVPPEARGPLPADGLLALFVDGASPIAVEHRLLWVDGARRPTLAPAAPPEDEDAFRDPYTGLLRPVPLRADPALSLPTPGSEAWAALVRRHPRLDDRLEAYERVRLRLLPGEAALLAHPAGPEAAADAAFRAGLPDAPSAEDWAPLLTVSSHLGIGLSFSDHGSLDVLVPRAALEAGRMAPSFAVITSG